MTDPNPHMASAPGEHAPAAPFSEAEWNQLQADDLSAGKAVVLLMLCIFSVGVLLYLAVAYTVWQGIGFLS